MNISVIAKEANPSLLDNIRNDFLTARKNKETVKSNLLGTLISEATKNSKTPTDDVVIAVIKKFIKNIIETLKSISVGWDTNSLQQELVILNNYLPKQFSREELTKIILKWGSTDMKSIMAFLKETYPSQYDSAMAAEIVKSLNT